MNIDEVARKLHGIPSMTFDQAKEMRTFILKEQPQNILELGFWHGVSTCYMAATLDEMGKGSITTIDLEHRRTIEPNIEFSLNSLGLQKFVTVYYEPTSYIWRLMKMLEKSPIPKFDLCYIDGAHSWFVDGFAFLLVDKFLAPGGWIIFDDLDWTYGTSLGHKNSKTLDNMPLEEKETPQIRKVYELLVKTHSSYNNFLVKDGCAYAQKTSIAHNMKISDIKKEFIYEKEYVGLCGFLLKVIKNIIH